MESCNACLNLAGRQGVELGMVVTTEHGEGVVEAVTHGEDRATPFLVLVHSPAFDCSWLVPLAHLGLPCEERDLLAELLS